MEGQRIIKYLIVHFTFEGIHHWESETPLPKGMEFLANPHRHVFHVRASVEVTKDREIEFIDLKRQMEAYAAAGYHKKEFVASCEEIALDFLNTFKLASCSVLEDGENGAGLVAVPQLKE